MTGSHDLLATEFRRIRDELEIPAAFPPEVSAEAEALAARDPHADSARYNSLEHIPFVTIDPPTSRDLDQAFHAVKRDDGYAVHYAIDDVSFFVPHSSAVEAEAWRRGETLYSPDLQTPLYPPVISEGAASLLPDVLRPAVVFAFKLNSDAAVEECVISRSLIRSRAKLSYPEVEAYLNRERAAGSSALAGHEWSASLVCLEEIGRARQRLEAARGGVSLRIPAQQVERWAMALAGYRLAFESASPVEEWNAQISLMTGMAAAELMLARGVGLLRALDPPRPDRVRALRLTAAALDVTWPPEMDYNDFVRGLDPTNPIHAVLLHRAAKVMGGARYVAFEGAPPHNYQHAAIAAPYAHVTAPLRRLADRYVLDLVAALALNEPIAPWLIDELHRLPATMEEADRRARLLESRIVDFAEARFLQARVGEVFAAVVIELRQDSVIVQITDPPVRTSVAARLFAPDAADAQPTLSADGATLTVGARRVLLGEALSLRLDAADPGERAVSFTPLN